MPFVWRKKSDHTLDAPLHVEALNCLEAAYVLIDIQTGNLTFSPNFHVLLGCGAAIDSTEQIEQEIHPDAVQHFHQVVNALKKGQVTTHVFLRLKHTQRTLAGRSYMAPSEEQDNRTGVLWLYDISSESRKEQRLVLENEKLKEEIKRYSTMLNVFSFPVWQRNKDLNIEHYNLTYTEMVAELAQDEDEEDIPELDRKAKLLAEQAFSTQQTIKNRRHIIIGGQRRMFDVEEIPVQGEDILVGVAQDVTEIDKLQRDLQRHISAQEDLLESSASAMAIYGSDMRLKQFNYAFVTLWKLDEQWLSNEPTYGEILELLREQRALPEQANFQAFKQQQLEMFRDAIEPVEDFFYLPDGRALRIIVIPHALGGLLFAYEDVTDRLALERSYNTLIAVQQETLDHLAEGIAVFGEDGRLKLSNPMYLEMWKIDRETAKAEPHIADLIDRSQSLYIYDDWDKFRESRVAQTHSRVFQKKRLERSDGMVIDCTTVPLPEGATLITYLDVTDSILVERSLRERNEALQEADRLKSEFLANVSYELRSPLTSISGFSEMLRQEYIGELTDRQKEYVAAIHKSSQHLMQLINDILDLASIEAGYLQLDVSEFDVYGLLQSVLSLTQERIKESDINIKFICNEKIGSMTADETRLKQVLFNLLSNAIKFSPANSTITLGAEIKDTNILFWVEDEGYGIPEQEQMKVFETFYKAHNEHVPKSRSKRGTGLGLSVVKHFIELHGGRVELSSLPESGTRITCNLPLKPVKNN